MLAALDKKLLRDLARLKGQVATIALVVAAGIASFVAMRGSYASLEAARARFYEQQRFADLFVELERAPEAVRAALEVIPGVGRVETRVSEAATLPLEEDPEPLRARVVSLPRAGEALLNAIRVRSGRLPTPDHPDEALLLHGFAEARGLRPGDRLPVVVNGKRRELRIVGTAVSPEYVMAIPPGGMGHDPERYAVVWMSREALAAAFDMEGAFNDVALALRPGASAPEVIARVDRLLAPYGGLGAYGRDRQASNHALEGELRQLASFATLLPAVFLAVAALLVNLVLSRLVQLAQPEIATLKAVGYSSLRVGLHFLELVLVVGVLGAVAGLALGAWLGGALIDLYARFFRFPELAFHFDPGDALTAVTISFVAGSAGAFLAVRRAVRLPPAEAMRPPAPARYRRSIVDRLGLGRFVGPSAQMILRELERRPLRAVGSTLAIAAATALTVVGGWYYDGVERLVRTQFEEVMREDVAVTFFRPRPLRAVRALGRLPGVLAAEGLRAAPVRFYAGHHQRDGVVWGYPDDGEMRALRDRLGRPVPLPPDGVVLTDKLAEILGVSVGDVITLELREGRRGRYTVHVAGLTADAFGLQGHMRLEAMARLFGEEPLASLALLRADPAARAALDRRLKELPVVASVVRRSHVLERFREQSAEMILVTALVVSLFAATITIGVVYNNARVALSMRARDLASLRVLGFTRGEISAVLLGELALQVLLALPLGLWAGRRLVHLLAAAVDPETYRLPVILTARGYAFAATVTLVAALVSALLVRRRLDRLDLVGVLKTRE